MEISFVIPLFNCLELTRACLASLQATLPKGLDHEILLVDDGSTDGTREWLRTLTAPCRGLLNPGNLGYAAANNRAAREARGTFLALLNNDLVLRPGWLEPMLRAFSRFSDIGLAGNVQLNAGTRAVDHAGIQLTAAGKLEHVRSRPPLALYTRRLAATAACCLVRRDDFLALDGFDESFVNGGEDIDFALRLRRRHKACYVANRSVVLHHVSASPGRKRHDEENSRRLYSKQRDALLTWAEEEWPDFILRACWENPHLCAHPLAHLALPAKLGARRATRRTVRALFDAAFREEEARWGQLLRANLTSA